ncbi:hemerythrin domain-containing protein [Paraburkholderia bryophila]|uniref:Hemerythrin-like domain-containing protein n=1 Tax=Paraburkholderia bryophila TaxID=420952 RepID=A0A7Y9WHM8_9BURK|nr:hemerythrin domain-containing protein [Paraburkholderia bryophila]NYH21011.1 hemerythrin-like domain-containing protein [Paraburkholderia bryophila]
MRDAFSGFTLVISDHRPARGRRCIHGARGAAKTTQRSSPMTAWARTDGCSIIIKEHQQLTTVIGAMLQFVHRREQAGASPAFVIFRAMLYYIREYPERVHHPKEERYLFARLRARTSEINDVLDELNRQHAEGEVRVRSLEHSLTRYELVGDAALEDFRRKVERYADFYANHRRIEEEVVLPVALRVLTREDWAEIDAAFGANRDPFEGVEVEEDLDKLFCMISNIASQVSR